MTIKHKAKVNNTEDTKKVDVFKTADFVLSVFLLYSGVELIRAESYPDEINKNKKNFVFKNNNQLEVLLNHFISSDPTVKLKKFISAQKQIKRLIYE